MFSSFSIREEATGVEVAAFREPLPAEKLARPHDGNPRWLPELSGPLLILHQEGFQFSVFPECILFRFEWLSGFVPGFDIQSFGSEIGETTISAGVSAEELVGVVDIPTGFFSRDCIPLP